MKKNYFLSLKKQTLVSAFVCTLFFIPGFNAQLPVETGNKCVFRENKGQVSDQFFRQRNDVLFSAYDGQVQYHFLKKSVSYQLCRADQWTSVNEKLYKSAGLKSVTGEIPLAYTFYRLDLEWIGSGEPHIIAEGVSDDYENYYLESCPNGALQVRSYKGITYSGLYNGIKLKWYSSEGHFKYDYLVEAGADYRQIQVKVKGAELSLDNQGRLEMRTPLGNILEEAPLVMQDGRKLSAAWVVNGDVVSLSIQGINSSRPLVIDPLIRFWGTFYGGNSNDHMGFITTDQFSNIFVSGQTLTTATLNIATVGAHQTTHGGLGNGSFPGDALLIKFNPNGQRQWATYFGGSQGDFGNNVSCDGVGNVYLGGGTASSNTLIFATPGCHQPVYAGGPSIGDGFLAKFSASGQRLWSTYYGSDSEDWVLGVNTDLSGNVFICGGTHTSTNNVLGTPGTQQPACAGGTPNVDAYLAKFDSNGQRLWGTYCGDPGYDNGHYCVTDSQGNVYLTGVTMASNSSVIASPGAHQPVFGGGTNFDAYIVKYNSTGTRIWGTFYGGAMEDSGNNLSVDKNVDVYMAGITSTPISSIIATSSAHQPNYTGAKDAFLVKFSAAGVRLLGTYYGAGSVEEWGYCAVDGNGYIYLGGQTTNATGTAIATPCSYQPLYGGGSYDCFLAKFDPNFQRMWGTYYGGPTKEDGWGLAIDRGDNVILGGSVANGSVGMHVTPGAHQTTHGSAMDIFLAKFDGCRGIAPFPASALSICHGVPAILTTTPGCATYWYSAPSGNNLLFPGTLFTGPITKDTTFYAEDLTCGPGIPRTPVHLTVVPGPSITLLASSYTMCAGESVTLSAFGAQSYSWTGNSSNNNNTQTVIASPGTVYSVQGTGSGSCAGTATLTLTANPCLDLNNFENDVKALKVYPNPASGVVHFLNEPGVTIDVYYESGIYLKTISASGSMDIKDLRPGFYFLVPSKESGYRPGKLIVVAE